jgi:quercetin dioxygenase-like cupin family protein
MEAFELADLRAARRTAERRYLEFIKSADLSIGIYELPAGGVDPQGPHTEDEAYYVTSGRATVLVGEENRPVMPGSVVFVAANVVHRFHHIEEDLVILVAFGPAEGSRAASNT